MPAPWEPSHVPCLAPSWHAPCGVVRVISVLRAQAYARPTHDPLHWLLLLMADRIETTLARPTRVVLIAAAAALGGLLLSRRR